MKKLIGLFAIAALLTVPVVGKGSDHAKNVKSHELSIGSTDLAVSSFAYDVVAVDAPVSYATPTAFAANVYVSTPVFNLFALVPDTGVGKRLCSYYSYLSYKQNKPGNLSPHNKSYCYRHYNGKLYPERRTC